MNAEINAYIDRQESVLQQILAEMPIPAELMRKALNYSLFPGGKRLRPVLIYLCGEILQIDPKCLDILAAAMELTHSYSLIHDDLPAMDNDDMRRGKPSCHKAFDEATAILVGDGLQALAMEILLTHLPKYLSFEQVVRVSQELVQASGFSGMVSGQSLDLSELSKKTIDENELCTIHALKTGKLFLACANMALAASEASPETAKALRAFTQHFGLVFQMQDDYLDRYGYVGKGRTSDLANEKTTFADLYSQDALWKLIHQNYDKALEALAPLSGKAKHLHVLILSLRQGISNSNKGQAK